MWSLRFALKRLPFGISSASEIYQRRITEILADEPRVAVNQDDVLIGGVDDPDHDVRLARIKTKLDDAGVKLNEPKCAYKKPEVIFHGHKFSAAGVSPDPAKVEAINEMPPPTNTTELRRILGMANWLGGYVPHMATVLQPLNALLRDDVD